LQHALGETYEASIESHEQTETQVVPAAMDAAHLEAEFDMHAAQLLFAPGEGEIEHLVASYGESEQQSGSLAALDNARVQLAKGLSEARSGENVQPVMEQFIPAALWPVAKTAITILGRPKLVSFLGGLLSKLIKPLIGADGAGLLAPAIADAGLRIFGLEASGPQPRAVLGEALAATVEETVHSVNELPPHVLENETLLKDAVQEAFESAAASYFPNSAIKPELRESTERHGVWARMPARSSAKRYSKYADTIPVEISPRAAHSVDTFGGRTLHDHLLPGTRASTIARAEGFPASQLHPLTPHAAGVVLGPNAALGLRHTPSRYMDTPQRLHVNQRLYRLHPPAGRHHHVRHQHSELLINLQRGEIRLWLYVSEPLCQRIAADLAKSSSPDAVLRRLKPLLARVTHRLKEATAHHHHLPPEIQVVTAAPNPDGKTHHWLGSVGQHLAGKIHEWAQAQLVQYLGNNVGEIKRLCTSVHDGITLRFTMTRVPGMDLLVRMSQGNRAPQLSSEGWPKGSPSFQVIARPGFAVHRLRD
jgi:hypothetical protein